MANINISNNNDKNKIMVHSVNQSKNVEISKDATQYYSNLAKQWANETGGTVDGTEFSSKYYAQLSKEYAEDGLSEINSAVAIEKNNFAAQKQAAVEAIANVGDEKIAQATAQAEIAVNASNNAVSTVASRADKDLSNISSAGKDMINSSKAYFTGGVSNDEYAFNQLAEMKRSTFDESKFIVVGSPVVTDDGVASGFSDNICVKLPYQLCTGKNYTFYIDFNGVTNLNSTSSWLMEIPFGAAGDSSKNLRIIQSARQDNNKLRFALGSTKADKNTSIVIEPGKKYNIKIDTDFATFVTLTDLNTNSVTTETYNETEAINGSYNIILGNTKNLNRPFNGSIDLSQFSITADGQEVFSGNKTGLDVVKPDDYTVVGSPVIIDDGIASGFSASSYLNIPVQDLSKNDFEISYKFTYTPTSIIQNIFRCATNTYGGTFGFLVGIDTQGKIYLSGAASEGSVSTPLIAGKTYTSKIKITGTSAKLYINGVEAISYTWNKSISAAYISIGNGSNTFAGSIDLNSFKIYVDGDLVYQPCLKIPYTDSKTGSKIVDAVYRDRVQDIYEQYGTAMYYTLDEENKNFTLPMGEIYGMIGQKNPNGTITDTIPLFTPMYFNFEPNHPSWLKAGEQHNNAGIYAAVYNKLVQCLIGTNAQNLKVIDVSDMISGVDYSYHWKVNQEEKTFQTPAKSETKPMGETAQVMGNGLSIGLYNDTNYGTFGVTDSGVVTSQQRYGSPAGTTLGTRTSIGMGKTLGITTDPTKSGLVAQNISTAQLYFKVANAVENFELLNVGEVLEALSDKIGRQECKAYITETYQNGSSWYRVWSDGWCEQGGEISGNETVTLLKSYTDNSYNIQLASIGSGNGVPRVTSKTTDTFIYSSANFANTTADWRACGYIN